MAHEVVPPSPHHVGFASEAVTAVREHDEIEVLIGLDQRIHNEERVVWRDVAVHGAMGEEELTFQICR